jgi:hypothetical protein
MSLAQRLFDWADKYRGDYDPFREVWTWPGLMGWFAKRLNDWIYDHYDIIPF